jgi:hypothetical protein
MNMKRTLLIAVVGLLLVPLPVLAGKDDGKGLKAEPFEFVGKAGDCGAGYPAGSNIVTAKWLDGMGLPDNGGQNVGSNPQDNPNKKDKHRGLLLSKNGTTPDCSSAGARIKGVEGMTVTPTFAIGFDYRNGGHCGAGAPRFDIDTNMGFFFVGCANAPQSPAPQDPLQWTRTRSVLTSCGSECFPGLIPNGAKIKSINIVFDEGTDTPNNDTQGIGLAVVDNIFINGQFITPGPTPKEPKDEPDMGSAAGFALLAGGPAAGAVTCTAPGSVTGDVGVVLPGTFTDTGCPINGTVNPNATAAYADFLNAYGTLASKTCDQNLTGTLAGLRLEPGVYCVDNVAKAGTLTLNGPVNGTWIFKVVNTTTGALTGTGFNVVMAGGAQACNVFWQVAEAVTMTTSNFQGNILAGADITFTGGTLNGDAWAGGKGTTVMPAGAVTLTGTIVAGCPAP